MNLTLLHTVPAQNLGWTLIHFLWQGAAVAVVVKLTLWALAQSAARVRYLVACWGLAVLLACPVVTFFVLSRSLTSADRQLTIAASARLPADGNPVLPSGPEQVIRITAERHASLAKAPGWLEARLPWVLVGWGAGVLLLSIRLAGGWWRVRQLAGRGLPLEEAEWQERLSRSMHRLGFSRPVRLVRSAFVRVPTAVGWLRPVVLLPVTSLTGLSPAELEALLAHELAHIRRHDYLVNFLQSVVEIILFYHPAVWWISGQVRLEREHACDDLVVAACTDRLTYARALASLEERCNAVQRPFALSASGGSLVRRMRRLAGQPSESHASPGWMIGMAVPVGFACALLVVSRATASHASPSPSESAAVAAGTGSAAPAPALADKPDPVGEKAPAPLGSPQLFTRSYKVDPTTFLNGIRAARQGTEEAPDPVDAAARGILPRSDVAGPAGSPNSPTPEWIRDYFRAHGFDPTAHGHGLGDTNVPQKALFYDDRKGLLLVRGTLEELGRVEKAVQAVNVAPPKVTIEIKFTELGDREINELGLRPLMAGSQPEPNLPAVSLQVTNRTGHLTQPALDQKANLADEVPPPGNQGIRPLGPLFDNPGLRNVEQVSPGVAATISAGRFRAIVQALRDKTPADLLAAPRVTTLSRREARIEVVEVKNVVTGVSISTDAHNKSSANYVPTTVFTGPSVDVFPDVAADGKTIRLTVTPSWTEFLGYDDPGPFVPQGVSDGNKLSPPLQVQRPLPAFHAVQTRAEVTLHDGETVVITGLGSLQARKENDQPPKAGTRSNRQLVIFVSPVIVSAD